MSHKGDRSQQPMASGGGPEPANTAGRATSNGGAEGGQVQAEAGELAAQLQAILAAVGDLVVYQDRRHRLIWANQAAAASLNLTLDQLIGRRCHELWHGRLNPCPSCPVEETLRSLRPAQGRLQSPDGRVWDISSYPVISAGQLQGVVEVTRDSTETVRQEQLLSERAAALEASERRFQDMLAGLRLLAVMLDTEGNITFANPFLLELTGWRWEEVVGKSWFEVFLPADARQRVRAEAFNGAMRAERFPAQYEHEVVTRTGQRRLIRWSNAFLRDAQGNIVGTASIGEDITTQRRLEQTREAIHAVAEAATAARSLTELGAAVHAVFRGLMPAENLYIALYDRQSDVVTFPYFVDLGGAPPGPRPRSPGLTEYVQKSGTSLLASCADVERLRAEGSIEGHYPTPQFYLGVPLKDERGEGVGVLAVQTYDPQEQLTEDDRSLLEFVSQQVSLVLARGRAWQALRESEERFRLLYEQAPLPYQSLDAQGRILQVNQAWLDLLGYAREQVIGRSFGDFLAPEHRDRFWASFSRLLAGSDGHGEYELLRADKSRLVVSVDGRIGRDSDGSFRGTHCILTNVTELRGLEAQLRQAQKMEGIGRLAGGIAHDFNNLLTAIIGNAGFLREALGPSSALCSDVDEVLKAAERATSLTRQLLAFSRRQMIAPVAINLNDLILDMDKMLRRLVGEDIELVTIPGEELWAVRVDPGQIEQVLVNLVVNARDAMPQGGVLTIETANVVLDEAYVRRHHDAQVGEHVMLAVSDSGTGMSEEVQAHLFEPFFTTKEVGKGTGLGLATVYGIVKQHGGNIWVYSELGKGTSIKVYLPRVVEAAQGLPRRDSAGYLPRGSETVLLVEDEPAVRRTAARILRTQGYSVIEASNGEEALRRAAEERRPIHLVITDVVMPRMGGKELASKLQAAQPQLAVLFTSGYTENAIVHRGVIEAGRDFLQKPFTAATLARKVRQVLDAARSGPGVG